MLIIYTLILFLAVLKPWQFFLLLYNVCFLIKYENRSNKYVLETDGGGVPKLNLVDFSQKNMAYGDCK